MINDPSPLELNALHMAELQNEMVKRWKVLPPKAIQIEWPYRIDNMLCWKIRIALPLSQEDKNTGKLTKFHVIFSITLFGVIIKALKYLKTPQEPEAPPPQEP